ncbi:MAG TPA: hypothetical protein VKX45_15235 [Bryobacteraceae bacterium]|jgi:hypothetical protein|nr:hypothetical protein [Bryobacteraceae bacterium]
MSEEKPGTREVKWEEGARQINDCDYLYAVDIRETEELTLQLEIAEARAQDRVLAPRDDTWVEQLRLGARPIETDPTCRFFRLTFDRSHMVSYTVLNECYGIYPQPPEVFTGKLFREFSHSHLLEFTKRSTYASDEHPGVLQHYEVACLNHVIDVICTGPPRIEVGRWTNPRE